MNKVYSKVSSKVSQQTAERIARAMLANGLDLSLVAKLTGLAPECLARLQH